MPRFPPFFSLLVQDSEGDVVERPTACTTRLGVGDERLLLHMRCTSVAERCRHPSLPSLCQPDVVHDALSYLTGQPLDRDCCGVYHRTLTPAPGRYGATEAALWRGLKPCWDLLPTETHADATHLYL